MARGELLSKRLSQEQLSKAYLEMLYFDDNLSMAQIAKRYQVYREAVRQLFLRHGFPRRTTGAGRRFY